MCILNHEELFFSFCTINTFSVRNVVQTLTLANKEENSFL
jgi:hypothetical protein